jgi:hypothetical protein
MDKDIEVFEKECASYRVTVSTNGMLWVFQDGTPKVLLCTNEVQPFIDTLTEALSVAQPIFNERYANFLDEFKEQQK